MKTNLELKINIETINFTNEHLQKLINISNENSYNNIIELLESFDLTNFIVTELGVETGEIVKDYDGKYTVVSNNVIITIEGF